MRRLIVGLNNMNKIQVLVFMIIIVLAFSACRPEVILKGAADVSTDIQIRESSEHPDYFSRIDLSDLEAVDSSYLQPLVSGGTVWYYSWDSVSEIKADDFVLMCANNNYLKLPVDAEGIYESEYANAPANQVEAAIQERFDVTTEYLRTSQFYSAKDDTYYLVVGSNSGWYTLALAAEQNADYLIIDVGIHCPLAEDEEEPNPSSWMLLNGIQMPDGLAIPAGTLRLKIVDKQTVEYISYKLFDEDFKRFLQ